MTQKWYVVHAYSGFENQVRRTLQERIQDKGLDDMFSEILVPTEEVVETADSTVATEEVVEATDSTVVVEETTEEAPVAEEAHNHEGHEAH